MSEQDPTNAYNQAIITPDENRRMFDAISGRYDLLNRLMSMGRDQQWRREAVNQLRVVSGGHYVDAGCGTGDLAIEIIRRLPLGNLTVSGIDHSDAMLGEGRGKIAALGAANSITLATGDAVSLPFKDSSLDGVISGFVIRNIGDRTRALAEWYRVTKPGGRCVILELSVPEQPFVLFFYKVFTRLLVPAAGAVFSRYKAYVYLIDSIRAFPPPTTFEAMLTAAGFKDVRSQGLTFGAVRIYCGTKG